jgi:hypothetical protein
VLRRDEVIQQLIDLSKDARYLEIGVLRGQTFLPVKAKRKVAVDPRFLFDHTQPIEGGEFHQITSDEYFGTVIKPDERFDVIFLDGLHTSDQTLRDLNNAIIYLAEGGVIVVDDAIPSSYPASLRDRKAFFAMKEGLGIKKGAWMGDVFRLIFFIETFMQAWSYRVVSDNHGQIILWKQRRASVTSRTIEEVAQMEYKDIFTSPPPRAPLTEIIKEISTT